MTGQVALILAAWFVVVGWRYHTISRELYTSVKAHLRTEQYAADRQRTQTPQPESPLLVSPANPYLYVRIRPRPLFAALPVRRNVAGALVHWTPLVAKPDEEWRDELVAQVAYALGGYPEEFSGRMSRRQLGRRRILVVRTGHLRRATAMLDDEARTTAFEFRPTDWSRP